MRFLSKSLLGLAAASQLVSASRVIHKDVVVVGGGASGAYAAVRIRNDFHKSIALIEKQDILVGDSEARTCSLQPHRIAMAN